MGVKIRQHQPPRATLSKQGSFFQVPIPTTLPHTTMIATACYLHNKDGQTTQTWWREQPPPPYHHKGWVSLKSYTQPSFSSSPETPSLTYSVITRLICVTPHTSWHWGPFGQDRDNQLLLNWQLAFQQQLLQWASIILFSSCHNSQHVHPCIQHPLCPPHECYHSERGQDDRLWDRDHGGHALRPWFHQPILHHWCQVAKGRVREAVCPSEWEEDLPPSRYPVFSWGCCPSLPSSPDHCRGHWWQGTCCSHSQQALWPTPGHCCQGSWLQWSCHPYRQHHLHRWPWHQAWEGNTWSPWFIWLYYCHQGGYHHP